MTLVVGATGSLGTEICQRLASAGKPFRAMVRRTSDQAKKDVLKQLGGELVEADLKDRASLDRACQGATAIISTPTAILSQQSGDTFDTVDLHGQMDLIDAARAAKVGRYVFVSVSGNLLKNMATILCLPPSRPLKIISSRADSPTPFCGRHVSWKSG